MWALQNLQGKFCSAHNLNYEFHIMSLIENRFTSFNFSHKWFWYSKVNKKNFRTLNVFENLKFIISESIILNDIIKTHYGFKFPFNSNVSNYNEFKQRSYSIIIKPHSCKNWEENLTFLYFSSFRIILTIFCCYMIHVLFQYLFYQISNRPDPIFFDKNLLLNYFF